MASGMNEELSNIDPYVVALLQPVKDDATKNELHTRIAMIKLRQSHILGYSQYAGHVLEEALSEATKNRKVHEMLGEFMRKLELRAAKIKDDKKDEDEATTTKGKTGDKNKTTSTNSDGNDKEKENDDDDENKPLTAEDAERLKGEVSEKSARIEELEKMMEERLLEEIDDIKEERATINELEGRLRKRIQSLQTSIKQMPVEREAKLQEAFKSTYDFTEAAGNAECIVCCNHDAVRAVIPCGHLCLCDKCTETLASSSEPTMRQCPLCRGNLFSTLKIYTAKK